MPIFVIDKDVTSGRRRRNIYVGRVAIDKQFWGRLIINLAPMALEEISMPEEALANQPIILTFKLDLVSDMLLKPSYSEAFSSHADKIFALLTY